MLATATVVGRRYVLGPVIGRGGGADVFRAEDTETGNPVAIKVLRSVTTDDLRRFDVEAETLSRLDHPAIVRMCDRGDHDGIPYLVLDLIDGESLSEVLHRGPLREDEVVRVGGVLASALAQAHQLDIVHRDVKPGNVLFDGDGNVHLTDFGIARLTDVTAITSKGLVIGTAGYLAPEQVTGEGASRASDIYALGLVLIESLTAQPSFGGTGSEAALARLHHQPDVPATSSPSLTALLTAMTAFDAAERPTATTVAASLRSDATAVLPVAREATTAIPVEPDATAADVPIAATAAADRRLLVPLIAVAAVLFMILLGWASSGGLKPARLAPAPIPPTTAPPPTTAAVVDTAPPDTQPATAPRRRKKDD